MMNFKHTPVLIEETIGALSIQNGKRYIDSTLGGGGHSKAILEKGGVVLGTDQDEDALEFVRKGLRKYIEDKKLIVVKGNFRDIRDIAKNSNFTNVDGILFDFGVSSYQLDDSGRGFSIKKDEKLDMRMDKNLKLSAFDIVNEYSRENLEEIFYKYGEEHKSREIAIEIVEARKKKLIETTFALAVIIEKVKGRAGDLHPATKIFQAIRIEVNGEIEAIRTALRSSIEILKSHGRIVAISFHSLEDREVKRVFVEFERQGLGQVINKKPILPSDLEVKANRRSRSAKLRVFEKI